MLNIKDKKGNNLSVTQVLSKISNRASNIFLDFELMLLRWVGHIPFHTFRLFAYKIAGVKIGKGSRVHMWCNFFNPQNIEIGKDTIIGDHAFLDGRAKISIGNHVAAASHVLIYNSQHDINNKNFEAIEKEVRIDDYVFLGPRVIILPDVHIGKGAVVGAGSVVTKDVPPFSFVAGVPAKFIRERPDKNLNYILGRARLFQ